MGAKMPSVKKGAPDDGGWLDAVRVIPKDGRLLFSAYIYVQGKWWWINEALLEPPESSFERLA